MVFLTALLLAATPALAADPCDGAIPTAPVSGTFAGKAFAPEQATIYSVSPYMGRYTIYYLSLQNPSGDDLAEFGLVVRKGTEPGGMTFRELATDDLSKQPIAGKDVRQIDNWKFQMREAQIEDFEFRDPAAIRVELDAPKNGAYAGRLAFCVPAKNAAIMGTFTAKIIKPE